jgi:hypothetical protein
MTSALLGNMSCPFPQLLVSGKRRNAYLSTFFFISSLLSFMSFFAAASNVAVVCGKRLTKSNLTSVETSVLHDIFLLKVP